MKNNLIAVFTILFTIALTAEVFGQGPQPGRRTGNGWEREGSYQRLYNPDSVETLTGEVHKVEYFAPMKGMGQGVHLQLKSDDKTLPIHLGPRWFLDNQDVEIKEGDRIKVKGSRITFEDKPAIIASEIEKGYEILKLRDDKGFPMWAGWRRTRP